LSRRADGYHNIESVFYPIPLRDGLEAVKSTSSKTEISFSGLPISGEKTTNLVWKAWELLHEKEGIGPVTIHLHKVIPMGAGLGGGSADGAFMIDLLSGLFDLNLDASTQENYALELGSDCPFFIRNKPQLVTGRGEILNDFSLDLSGKYIVLVNPGIHVGTQEAYSNVQPKTPEQPLSKLLSQPLEHWKGAVKNQCEDSVFPLYPEIGHLKAELEKKGAVYTSMTGSGSTVYGLFNEDPGPLLFGKAFVWQSAL